MTEAYLLPIVWAGLIAFAVLAYVVLDGFDLGVGILFGLEREYEERSVMVNAIAPMWDGNETWLVLGGGGLFAVFPLAYAIIMPAMYPTIIAMLLALIFRGVAFEFRFRAETVRGRWWWDLAFWMGSTLAAFAQGLTLGGLLQGIKVSGRAYAGGWWDWLDGFTVLCGVAVVAGYALLGATWLVWRTEGALQRRARRYAELLGVSGARFHRRREHMDALSEPGLLSSLVRLAGHCDDRTGAGARRAAGVGLLGRHPARASCDAVLLRDRLVRAVFCGAWHQHLADDGAADDHHLAGCLAACEPAFSAGRCLRADPDHPRLYRLQLLGVQGQGGDRHELPLMGRRLLWFVALYVGGVAVVGVIAGVLRMVLGA